MGDASEGPVLDRGEMAEVVAGWDWASTPVGPPETWPLSLRTVVRLLLTSRFPMWAGYGPELTFFYNDAYRRDTLGMKHPWALGRPAQEVWAEIWDDIGPRISQVLDTGTATWDEALQLFLERSGYREETYHTFSYSPIADDSGEEVVGMLCVVSEETDRVIGERRMATLRELAGDLSGRHIEDEVIAAAERRIAANPQDLPFALLYLEDEDGTVRLATSIGFTGTHPAAPAVLRSPGDGHRGHDGADAAWPVDEVLAGATTRVVEGLGDRFDVLPCGAWDDPPARAAVVPLTTRGHGRPAGALVVGLNPYRPADHDYLAFLELIADQIAAGVAGARTYEAERRRAESLAELDRAKTEFFSNVSHEFRTPLTLIAGPVEDSLRDGVDPLPPAHRQRLELVRRNTGRLRRLVNNMLDFARIEAGRVAAERVAVDLAEFTRDLAASFAPAIERAGLRFEVDCPPLAGPVYIDREMWERIVLNLLSNALKFTLDGSISIALHDIDAGPELTVRDTGAGIPADELPHLFDRFHRVSGTQARSHEGTGIGLALVQQFVHLHDGSVEVESVEGRGTAVVVRVPYGTGATGAGAQYESSLAAYLDEALQWTAAAEQVDADEGERVSEGTVLVVDDNPDLRDYIARLLRPHWDVVIATDGEEALARLAERTPDLVLSDVMMPGLDGFELLARLRADPATATLPVILLSARAGEDSTIEGLEAGADDYLVKPFSSQELLARVRSALLLGRMRNREATWRTALVDSLDDAVVIADATGTVVEVNAAAGRLLGLDPAGVPYRPPHPFWPDGSSDPEELAAVQHAFGEALTTGRFQGRLHLRHDDGHLVPCDVAVSSVFDRDERMFVATFRDLTDELRASARQAALTRLATDLSEVSGIGSVLEAAAAGVRAAFGATQVVAAALPDGGAPIVASSPPGWRWDDLDEPARAALSAPVHDDGPVAMGQPERPSALVLPAEGSGVGAGLWVQLDPPRPLSAEERSLASVLGSTIGQALARAEQYEVERTIATAMQRSILGPVDELPGVAVRYTPAEEPLQVGGDWYDVVDLGDGRVALVVGDCVGHGLGAATVMGQLRSACRALLVNLPGPADVLTALDAFAARIPGAPCTTALCLVIQGDQVRYSSAGHVPAVLVHPDGTHRLLEDGRSVPLATRPIGQRPEGSLELVAGSALLLYTDGLIERRGESLDAGLDRLERTLTANRHLAGEALIDQAIGDVLPAGRQVDDVAVVAYRHRPGATRFTASVGAEASELGPLRRSFRAWLHETGADDASVTDLLIALCEACTNSMEHAYRFSAEEKVAVSARLDDGTLEVVVVDDGPWRSPGAPDPRRGRGLAIMRGLMDDVQVDRVGDGTRVRMTKRMTDVG